MAGQINLELLIRVAAEQAKRELGAVTGATGALTAATAQLGGKAAVAGGQLDTLSAGAASAVPALQSTSAATAQMGAELTSYVATTGRAATAVAGMRNAVTGLTQNVSAQTLELIEARRETEAWQAVLDQTRARFNPLFAASRQYEQDLREIAEAERMGAISAMEASAARERAAQSMAPVNAGLRQQVQASGMATAANANLIAQWNDIGMMIAAGQSPMMLALQQGTQVSQVLNQMGGTGTSALRTLGTSFLGLISPMNIATIGIIGFGAAAIQWLMSLQTPTKTFDERLRELEETLGRVKGRVDLLADGRLEDRFGGMANSIRGLTGNLLELDRAAELRQLRETLQALTSETLEPTLFQRLRTGDSPMTPNNAGVAGRDFTELSDAAIRAENYANLGVANTYADFQRRQAEIMAAAQAGNGSAVSQGLGDLAQAMRGDKPVTEMSDEAVKLLLTIGQIAEKTAEVEAHFNGSAKAARATREATAISRELTQAAELSRAIVIFGENSAQVEAIRTAHAREALKIRLEEAGVVRGSTDEAKIMADFEADRQATQALADKERSLSINKIFVDLQQQAEVSDAISRYGANSAQVEALRAKHARDALASQLAELGAAPERVAVAMKLLELDQERIAAQRKADTSRQFSERLAELQNEASIKQASLAFGRDSLQVKQLEIAAERRLYTQQVETMELSREKKDILLQQWEISRGLAGADPFGTLAAGQELMRAQSDRVAQLRMELSLAGQNELVRARTVALYRAEQEIRERGIDASSQMAEQLRAGALDEVQLEARLDRITDAWGRVDNAAASAIDNMVDGLTGGGKDALRSAAQDMLGLIKDLTLANPLKNAILGSNLPTMSDVGGLGGIFGRLFGGASSDGGLNVSAMNAASMAVTTPMVTLNAGAIAGAIPGAAAGMALPGGGSVPAGLVRAIAPGAALPGRSDVQAQMWAFFTGKGLAPHQVAAILGHAGAESAFNPLAVGDNGAAHGLFQWNDRAPKLFNAIGGQQNLGNIQAQLEFAWHELMTTENSSFRRLQASTNVYDATHAFSGFERMSGYNPNSPQSAHGWDRRLAGAEAALDKFEGTAVAAQVQLGQLGTGAQTLGTGMQQMTAGLAGTLQGIGANYGPGGAFVGGLLGEGLKWLTGGGTAAKPGFMTGGYTGAGATTDVAGVVHAEEYVFDAASTRKIGVANLEALRRGALKGYREGGYVLGATPPPSASTLARPTGGGLSGGGQDRTVTMNLHVSGTGNAEIREAVQEAIRLSIEQFDRDVLPGRLRILQEDKWGG